MKELCLRLIMTKNNPEFIIKALQDLHQKTVTQYDWTLEQNKKVMSTETENWYLRWKVGYLEQRIKEHLPDLALYDKDDEEFNRIKKDMNSHKELNDKE